MAPRSLVSIVRMETLNSKMENENSKSLAKVLTIVSFALAIASIFLAIIFDFVAFKEVVLQFVAALILPCIAFVVLIIAMIASCIFIFGVYLIKEYGFWPLSLSIQFFREIIGDIKITSSQIQLFITFRIILLALCLIILGLAITARIMAKKDKEAGVKGAYRLVKGMSIVSIILATLGMIVSIGAIAIASNF